MADEQTRTQIEHADGRVELRAGIVLDDPRLYNEDLAPTQVARRTWTTYTYAALWISMAHCIPTYMLASGLIGAGMNWWQALVTILVGNAIVLVPILANSHPGTKYGVPFPVFARAAYGVFGANVPAILRAIVACGWFGINAWIGGQALQTFFRSLWAGWPAALGDAPVGGHLMTEWLSFGLFWSLNILIAYRGMDLLRKVENLAAPFVLVMTAALVVWAIDRANGLGKIMSDPGKFPTFGTFWPVFVPSVTAMIGFWATLSLNMPDFTRFGRSQKEQAVGQVVALPTTMTVFSAMGVLITSASTEIYGKPIWDPVELVGHFESRVLVAVAMFTIVVATLSVNIAANMVSPANDFANIAPKSISFRTGALITGIFSVLMMPWKLIADPEGYIFKWLLGYSGGLGAIAGVLICDYWFIKRTQLELADLYRREGRYAYGPPGGLGTNWNAVIATFVGCFLAWIGLLVPALRDLFDYAWFVGGASSAALYGVLMRRAKP
ncbi:NCS1 family nucleobase:cation symporter-1 [Pendulispora albinea]|uniref:NCS1 family nucleobase:cation symporter-1 n=1 Tax=Pendulispora albinea TaxID=2741071 RepID=A0ABZ2MAY7_9BACT